MISKMTANSRILLFGGTTEGRLLAERLLAQGLSCTVCVATEYGAQILAPHPLLTVRTGRMDRTQMADLMREGDFVCAADATHPFAAEVTQEIREACRQTGLLYLRLQRKIAEGTDPCIFVNDMEEAGAFLAKTAGTILVTTGSKELAHFVGILGDPARVAARVLPSFESLDACRQAGLQGRQILAMQGPFDIDMNCAQIRHTGASWLLTKASGETGGYPAKIEAARQCGISVVAIRPPQPGGGAEKTSQPTAAKPAVAESAGEEQTVAEPAAAKPSVTEPAVAEQPVSQQVISSQADRQQDAADPAEMDPDEIFSRILQCVSASRGGTVRAAGEDIRRPAENAEDKKTYGQAVKSRKGRVLFLVGIGVGARQALTLEALEALTSAEVIFAAQSVLNSLTQACPEITGKKLIPIYESTAILQFLHENPEVTNAAAAYSGDSGFYSGASSMLAFFRKEKRRLSRVAGCKEYPDGMLLSPDEAEADPDGPLQEKEASLQEKEATLQDLEIRVFCGISCVSWFAARIGVPWQDWKILSSHGRTCNIVGHVRRNRRCFVLLSGLEDLHKTDGLLRKAQEQGMLGPLRLTCGYELSRPAEKIIRLEPQDLMEITGEGLYVLYIENEGALNSSLLPGLDDTVFLRGKAPMTSSEVRALSLSRLGLTSHASVWDVGAGTGSVSVEAALACPDATVWSIEYKKEALALLRENRERFCLQNMEIVAGRAPAALEDLPAPTHVFIGGSGGEIEAILHTVFMKNPLARVVANCITSETLAALQTAFRHLQVRNVECTQIIVNRESRLGKYHYLRAGNPVFIISFQGSGTTPERDT